jgi:hypothetical protein
VRILHIQHHIHKNNSRYDDNFYTTANVFDLAVAGKVGCLAQALDVVCEVEVFGMRYGIKQECTKEEEHYMILTSEQAAY